MAVLLNIALFYHSVTRARPKGTIFTPSIMGSFLICNMNGNPAFFSYPGRLTSVLLTPTVIFEISCAQKYDSVLWGYRNPKFEKNSDHLSNIST